jgi:tetratricopeptide (TPR) repeat protein
MDIASSAALHFEDDPRYCSIHAAVLFADIQDSVLLSSSLHPLDYDELLNGFQALMLGLIQALREEQEPVAEYRVAGDQLSLFLYDAAEVERNFKLDGPEAAVGEERGTLIDACRKSSENLLYRALLAAIRLKNCWLVQPFNTRRVLARHEPYELSIGIHYGRVYLRRRADGLRRIEGYTVNLAKRIETASRLGRFSQIMLSQAACETIRNTVRGPSQVRQRVFFQQHELEAGELKGILKNQPLYELKFYHRLGLAPEEEAIPLYRTIFAVNPANAWAYYQLADHFAYQLGQWETARELAHRAQIVHPRDERVKYDLARCYFEMGDYDLSREYCEQALVLNPDFDLAYEALARIAAKRDDYDALIRCMRKAVSLSPRSAANHLNLALGLLQGGQYAPAEQHVREAIALWPQYRADSTLQATLRAAAEKTELPEALRAVMQPAPDTGS